MPEQKPKANLSRLYSTADSFTLQYLQHKRRDVEPKGLKWAKDNGYQQVHIAMLAQCEQPPAAKLPAFRATFPCPPPSPYYPLGSATQKRSDLGREIN